jgi:Holliday junction resolvase-like predicted endonuclease
VRQQLAFYGSTPAYRAVLDFHGWGALQDELNVMSKKGLWAEWLGCCVLWLKGYSILARRLKTPVGEIDIVAQKGRTLAIVEVKYRPFLTPDPIVLPRQRRRLELAANYFAKKIKEPSEKNYD